MIIIYIFFCCQNKQIHHQLILFKNLLILNNLFAILILTLRYQNFLLLSIQSGHSELYFIILLFFYSSHFLNLYLKIIMFLMNTILNVVKFYSLFNIILFELYIQFFLIYYCFPSSLLIMTFQSQNCLFTIIHYNNSSQLFIPFIYFSLTLF